MPYFEDWQIVGVYAIVCIWKISFFKGKSGTCGIFIRKIAV